MVAAAEVNADIALDAVKSGRVVGSRKISVWAAQNGDDIVPVFTYGWRGFTIVMPVR